MAKGQLGAAQEMEDVIVDGERFLSMIEKNNNIDWHERLGFELCGTKCSSGPYKNCPYAKVVKTGLNSVNNRLNRFRSGHISLTVLSFFEWPIECLASLTDGFARTAAHSAPGFVIAQLLAALAG